MMKGKNCGRLLGVAALLCAGVLPAVPACAQLTDAEFASELKVVRESAASTKKASRPFLRKILPGSSTLKLGKNLVVETNADYTVSRMLVSSEFKWGSEVLQEDEEEGRRGQRMGSRYIGYALAAEAIPGGRSGFAAGRYDNKAGGYIVGRVLPFGRKTYGGPGIVAFEILALGPHEAMIGMNEPVELPEDPKDPNSRKVMNPVAPTFYDGGASRALVVEVAHDSLQDLLKGKVEALVGTLEYYVRGGFNREVYDLYSPHPIVLEQKPWAFGNALSDLRDYESRFRQRHGRELAAGDPSAKAELDHILKMREVVDWMAGFNGVREVILRCDRSRSDRKTDVIVLQFP